MLGLDACELGAQLLELLRLALCARGERAGLGPGRPRGRGAPVGGDFNPRRGLAPPRGNFGGLQWDLVGRSPVRVLAGLGGFVQLNTHGERSQGWEGLFVKPGDRGTLFLLEPAPEILSPLGGAGAP